MSDICILFAVGGTVAEASQMNPRVLLDFLEVLEIWVPHLKSSERRIPKVGAVVVNSLPSHGPHRLPPTQHHQLRFLELNTAVLATVFSRPAFAALNVSRDRFLISANDVPALVAGKFDLVL